MRTPISLLMLVSIALAPAAVADSVTVPASRDNTLIEIDDGSRSIGAGPHLFAGRILLPQIFLRRGLVAFELEGAVPPGSTVTATTLTLHMSRTISGPQPVALHRVSADWGEGASSFFGGIGAPSEPGDATWIHTFYDDRFWAVPGGDFALAPSAQATVGDVGFYSWDSTPEMVADVQAWLDDPAANFGWILIGDEAVPGSVKRFDTRENPDETRRPRLTVEFEPPCEPSPAPGPGYWHRQCLTRVEPIEPNFDEAVACVEARLEALGLFGLTACDGIEAAPPRDACEQARRKLTALLFDVCTDRIQTSCPVRGGWPRCESEKVGGLLDELATMIRGGECRRAASCPPAP